MDQNEHLADDAAMARDLKQLRSYANIRNAGEPLDILGGGDSVALFRNSLSSALGHIRLQRAPRDAKGEALQFSAGFLDRMMPNAIADQIQGHHFIAVNTALFVAIQEFAMFCFTQRELFSDIGDSSLEVSPTPIDDQVPGLWLLTYTTGGGRKADELGKSIVPRDGDRYLASIYLGLLMVRFVWLHEFQHCFSGHVRFVQSTDRALHLNEIEEPASLLQPSRRRRDDSRAILKSLELEADRNAFWTSCRIHTDNRENIAGLAKMSPSSRLRLTLFGCYAMTWLFDEFQNYLDSQQGHTHPAPYLRLQNLVTTAANHLQPLHAEFEALHRDACMQFDAMQRAIPSIYKSEDVYRASSQAGIREALHAHKAELQALSGILDPLRYRADR